MHAVSTTRWLVYPTSVGPAEGVIAAPVTATSYETACAEGARLLGLSTGEVYAQPVVGARAA